VTGSVADGFAATFTIGLAGVASNVTDAEKLVASITSARVTKGRAVVVSVKLNGAATAHATLTRDGKTLAKATGQLTAGTHTLRIALDKGVAAGAATLKLVLVNAAGRTVTRTRTVGV
jgi:hypothetical protein